MNNYIEVIKTAVLFFPIIAFLFSIPFILHNYHKFGSISFLKSLLVYSFIFYLICAYFLVILPLPAQSYVAKLTTPKTQWIPFHFIVDFIKEANIINIKSLFMVILKPCFYVPIYNIVLTIPFAIYMRYYFNISKKRTIIYTFLLSLFFEITQLTGIYFIYPRGYRLFDIDDLLLNTFGGLIGYYVSIPILKLIPTVKQINKKSTEIGIKTVSGFRKATTLIMDLFLVFVLWFVIYMINNDIKHLFMYVLIVYMILIPLLFKGRTISEMFLNLIIVNKNNKVNILRTLFRRVLFFVMYIVFPYILMYVYVYYLNEVSIKIKLLILLLTAGLLFLYYAISIIKYFFIKKPLLYEKISGTKYISTIKPNDEKE